MEGDINNIHDKFVRATFMDAERAASFFEQMLPEQILKLISLETIQVVQESYMTEDLKEYFSDIVYRIKLKDEVEEPLEVALLFEHKSQPDKYVSIQVGMYMYAHWYRSINENKVLRPIIPIVYYQGERAWKVLGLRALFGEYPEGILGYLPQFEHIFIALNTLSTEEIVKIQHRLMAVAILAQQKRFNPIRFEEDLKNILKMFPNDFEDWNFIEMLFVYIINVSDIEEKSLSQAIELIPKNIKETLMTTYQRIIERSKKEGVEEGIEKGREEGIEKGREEGIEESVIKVILSGYENGIDLKLLSNITNRTEDEVREILQKNKKIDF